MRKKSWHWEHLREALRDPKTKDVDPVKIWKVLPPENPLVKLAILLLSFVPYSASTERLFSKMGDIKMKKCNRMHMKKLHDIAFVKSELRRGHAANETARRRLKRRFGNKATAADEPEDTGAGRLEDEEVAQDAEDTETKVSDNIGELIPASINSTRHSAFLWATAFVYPFQFLEDRWAGDLWAQGVKNYAKEMAFYDLLAQASSQGDADNGEEDANDNT